MHGSWVATLDDGWRECESAATSRSFGTEDGLAGLAEAVRDRPELARLLSPRLTRYVRPQATPVVHAVTVGLEEDDAERLAQVAQILAECGALVA